MVINTLPSLQLGRKAVEELVEQTSGTGGLLRYEAKKKCRCRGRRLQWDRGDSAAVHRIIELSAQCTESAASYSSAKQLSESGIQLLSARSGRTIRSPCR